MRPHDVQGQYGRDPTVHEQIECDHVEAELSIIFELAPYLEWGLCLLLKAAKGRLGRGWLGDLPYLWALFACSGGPFDSLQSRNTFGL